MLNTPVILPTPAARHRADDHDMTPRPRAQAACQRSDSIDDAEHVYVGDPARKIQRLAAGWGDYAASTDTGIGDRD